MFWTEEESRANNVDMCRRSVELYFQRVSDKALSKGHRWGPFRGMTVARFPNNQQETLAVSDSYQVSVMFVELEIAGDRQWLLSMFGTTNLQ